MTINELCKVAYEQAKDKGWHDSPRTPLEICALIHSEVSEVVEEVRKGTPVTKTYYSGSDDKPEGIPSELADIVIRIADWCGQAGIDLAKAVEDKLLYNKGRAYKHGKLL
jgi:NTP pyrophosphatase (non-canonical NTP hydrolase)